MANSRSEFTDKTFLQESSFHLTQREMSFAAISTSSGGLIVKQKGAVATGIRIAKAPVFLIGEQLKFHQSFSSHLLKKIIW